MRKFLLGLAILIAGGSLSSAHATCLLMCKDSDGGLSAATGGTVEVSTVCCAPGGPCTSSPPSVSKDTCVDADHLIEFGCVQGTTGMEARSLTVRCSDRCRSQKRAGSCQIACAPPPCAPPPEFCQYKNRTLVDGCPVDCGTLECDFPAD